MKNRFWNWIKNEGGRELRLEGVIADSTWYGDEVTPKLFRDELNSGNDGITVWINSYGGDCFAASQIYTMLKDYPAEVTVKIDGIAASAASVIAMAGDKVLMSPTSVIMIHNPATVAAGDTAEMRAAIRTLDEIKESIINAYELKTKMSRDKISKMMDAETWLNAKKAVELKFADDILFAENSKGYEVEDAVIYSRATITNSLLDRIKSKKKSERLDAAQLNKQTFKFNQVGVIKMADIQELRDKRLNLWETAKNFLDEHTKDGTLSAEDAATYEKMENDVANMGKTIERLERQARIDAELSAPASKPILTNPGDSAIFFNFGGTTTMQFATNRTTPDYRKHFYNAIRGGFKNESADFLRGGVDSQGGYLLPTELDEKIATRLSEENIMRRICQVITTKSRHEIPILASQPNAQWLAEGQEIDLQSGSFDRVTVGAYKLCAGVRVSNELLSDSYYNLQDFFAEEFSKSMAASEEQAFISGNGTTEPQGFLTALDAATDTAVVTTTAGANLAIDDLINVVYSLPRAYRQGACWLMHDSTIQAIRKIKDSNLQLYWTPATAEGEPPTLLGYKVFSSGFMPQYASNAKIVAFGNFRQGYVIGDRSQRTFKPLFELLALNDLSAFLMIERVDGRLVDKNAIKLLQLR